MSPASINPTVWHANDSGASVSACQRFDATVRRRYHVPGGLLLVWRPKYIQLEAKKVSKTENIEERVHNIVCEQLGTTRDKISAETSFINDLGADSLDTVELVMEFEDEFEINIPDEDAEKIQTVGDAVKYITGKLS